MLKAEDNDLLTRVGPGTPMHDYMRRHWLPAMRAEPLEAGGAPIKLRLLGNDYVAFRSPDGTLGLVDERCPHRCASLSIARNEEGGLRCIYHGWKFGTDGSLLDAPTEFEEHQAALRKRVKLRTYPIHEAAGLIWVYLGDDAEVPPLPAFEFMSLPADQVDVRIARLPVNWLQTLESVLDSAHLGYLHRSSTELAQTDIAKRNAASQNVDTAPRLNFEELPYGFRELAVRRLADGGRNVRTRIVVAPFYAFLAGLEGNEHPLVLAVPIDDHHAMQIFITYNPYRAFKPGEVEKIWFHTHPNRDDMSDPVPGPLGWPQDREAMRKGHFSGITNRHVFYEDFAVLQSMGPIVDRRYEHLCGTDATIVRFRKAMLSAVKEPGEVPFGRRGVTADDFAAVRTEIYDEPAEPAQEPVSA